MNFLEKWTVVYASQPIPFMYSAFGPTHHIPKGTEGSIVEVDTADPMFTYKVIFILDDSPPEGIWLNEDWIETNAD